MINMSNTKPLFRLGQIVATPGALSLLEKFGKSPSEYLARHQMGDWGDALCPEDKNLNDLALKDGSRLLSAFKVGSGMLWVITESDRSSTTLLLPSEY